MFTLSCLVGTTRKLQYFPNVPLAGRIIVVTGGFHYGNTSNSGAIILASSHPDHSNHLLNHKNQNKIYANFRSFLSMFPQRIV
ncbi:hypothetical protein HanRHA438_Chr02g0063231 [Helianthus annuus]|nr:hypothetical protein HanRHA438_Chr02g0063231 [Helianthus annuus]